MLGPCELWISIHWWKERPVAELDGRLFVVVAVVVVAEKLASRDRKLFCWPSNGNSSGRYDSHNLFVSLKRPARGAKRALWAKTCRTLIIIIIKF